MLIIQECAGSPIIDYDDSIRLLSCVNVLLSVVVLNVVVMYVYVWVYIYVCVCMYLYVCM